ncbi:hypothetical protein BV22DRAFT_1135650 [Leucogyrophana mollusca]|uniref:Uncharacterized protein n=1 Tax=Leucogyrophana mollusca TaxID=85980 RepID=A0ACB8AVA9_9AGAM|nr:hypothetical protein BV22DRAFT_1135650 [Leucogyrophana mollusca]
MSSPSSSSSTSNSSSSSISTSSVSSTKHSKSTAKCARKSTEEPAGVEPIAKRPRTDTENHAYINAARWIPRDIDLFCKLDTLFQYAPLLEQQATGDWSSPEEEKSALEVLDKLSTKLKERYTDNYKKIIALVPALGKMVGNPKKLDKLNAVLAEMQAVIGATRGEDMSRLKAYIGSYAAPDPAIATITPPIVTEIKGRTKLGTNHPQLAQLLCPVQKLAQFLEDPVETRKQLQNGRIEMSAAKFPSFMYEGKVPGENFDPTAIKKGWARGYLPIRASFHFAQVRLWVI